MKERDVVKKTMFIIMALFVLISQIGVGNDYIVAANDKDDFNISLVDEGIKIDKYIGNDVEVIIPAMIDNLPVVELGDNAFSYKDLISVEIPDSVTTIGNNAFYYNQLTSIELPSGITAIGSNVFRDNELTNVVIPSGVTSIGVEAFSGNKLTSVEIPNGVISIG